MRRRAAMNQSLSASPLKIGLFAIGLDTYWPQFPGLEERLKAYTQRVAQKLHRPGVNVVDLGMIDTPEKASNAGHEFRRADVDLIFLYVSTYALSSTVLAGCASCQSPGHYIEPGTQLRRSIIQVFNRLRRSDEKMTGEWLAHCSALPRT